MATLVTTTFEMESGLVEDRVVNTFAIGQGVGEITDSGGGLQPTSAEADTIANAIRDFYVADPGALLASVSDFLSPKFDNNPNRATVRFYNIGANMNALRIVDGGVPAGSPIWTRTFTLTGSASGADGLPSEVALAVTLETLGRADAPVEAPDAGDPGGLVDRPKQRRTGRLYIGPLNITTMNHAGVAVRPSAGFTDVVRQAVGDLQADIAVLTGEFFLGVWSRADGQIRALEAVSTDDAFDTQRRRGESAIARTRLALPV